MSYLDHTDLSPAQLAVLSDPTPRGLVAAGAGSGKTRLLVAYFVRALLDENVPLEDLAAVTFTRKAGSELADRIRRELIRCGHPEIARGIDQAAIGTIHGLCTRLLRQQPLRAGIDPSFGILEDDAASLVREEVSKSAWDQVIEGASESELEAISLRGDSVREQMLELYGRLQGMGQAVPHLRIEPGVDERAAREALGELCVEALSGTGLHCNRGPALDEDLGKIRGCLQWLERMAAGAEGPVVASTNGFFPSKKTRSAESWFSPLRGALIGYRCALAEVELRPVLAVTNRLLALFHEQYTAYKESRGVLDFADLELRAMAMLALGERQGPGAVSPPERPVFASRVLVDEFQDTNETQCAILDGLGADRVLMVGDKRQSIYRFRGADVDVFRRREEARDLGQHRLDVNYRSRREILDLVNLLFSSEGFFGSRTFEFLEPGRDLVSDPPVGRDPASSSSAGAGPTDVGPGAGSWISEVLVADRPVAAEGEEEAPVFHEAEARAVAARIRRLVDEEGFPQGSIVVLLPVLSNVGLYQEALFAQGLDIYVVRGKGYYSQDEVADVAALLRLLVNAHDDLSLVTVLRSPLVAVSDDCLYLLGREAHGSRARSLWQVMRESGLDALAPSDREKLTVFAGRLDTLRARVGRPGLSQLIDEAVTACDYDLCLLGAPEGKRRFANLRKLMRMAADFEALEGPNLAGFVALIGSLDKLGDSEGNAPSMAEGEDVVRIMTVHQAKGLEFPAVFLAGLGSPGQSVGTSGFVVGHDGRVAAVVKERDKNYETHAPHWGPAPEIIADEKRREDEEDVRLLYVAMTRARDRLFLVGARPKGDRLGTVPIGRIVAALGLEAFPCSGSVCVLDDISAAVIGVPYPVGAEGDEADAQDERPPAQHRREQGPEPLCFLHLDRPGAASRLLSFSALSALSRCPRRFYLERVLGLGSPATPMSSDGDGAVIAWDERPLDDVESDAGRDVGLLVHSLLERVDLGGGRPAPETLDEMAVALAADAGLVLSGGGIRRAAQLVGAFWDSPLAGDPDIGSALREQPFFFVHRDVSVQGVMDLLRDDEGRWRVVDYKSNALGGRSPEEVVQGSYELQAQVYCLAALMAGAPAVRMEFVFLEKPEQTVAFEYGMKDRQGLEERLDKALAEIEEGSYLPSFGAACADCAVADLCAALDRR